MLIKGWDDFALKNPETFAYIMDTRFWDADHVTASEEPTRYTVRTFCQNVVKDDFRLYAQLLTEPTEDTTGVVRFDYVKDGMPNYNTVEIPPFPQVKCIMTAAPDITAIPTGEKADVTITINTSKSYVLFKALNTYTITNRSYWASLGMPAGSGQPSVDPTYQITVRDVSPNSTIHVKAGVYCKAIDDSKIPGAEPWDYAEADVFIGETGSDMEMSPHATAVIAADPRDHEQFEVEKGIPSSEKLYVNVLANEYLYRFVPQQVNGEVNYSVTVNYSETTVGQDGKPVVTPRSASFSYSRSYSYWEVASLEVYAIDQAAVHNGALPGGKAILTPSSAYHVPDVIYIRTTNHVITGSTSITTSCSSSDPADLERAASNAVSSPTTRNDRLTINGKTIMSEYSFQPQNLAPSTISRDALYAGGLTIPSTTRNGSLASTGSITYERVYSLNPKGDAMINVPITNINPVFVHTPVVLQTDISSDEAHNQKADPHDGAISLILGRPFTISLSNAGQHLNLKGYGNRDYTAYVKDREIRFGFDAYLGSNMSGTYLKANTWHSLEDLAIAKNASILTFYTPTWVDEGLYPVEIRSLASNDPTQGKNVQERANTDPQQYGASSGHQVEVSGRVYDLKITDIDDRAWELFFRVNKGKPDPTGKKLFTGPNNINGDTESSRVYYLPVMPGKNDVAGYKNAAVKLGYAVKFELKTMGNYCDEYDFIRIMPSFAFVDKSGKNRQEVDLYYATNTKPLVRVGSPEDTLTQSMKLNFTYRGIPLSEFTHTAQAMFQLRGGMRGYTLEKWKEAFPKVSQNGVTVSKYFKILLSEPIRSFCGPDRGIPQGVDANKAFASVQKWYGEYCLPADCLVVPKGTDLSTLKGLTRNSPVFLKDGYIIVNFRDIAVIDDDDFEHPSLQYTGEKADGWALEGYNAHQAGWELEMGDFLVYHADQRSTDDNTSTGTH